MHEHAIYFSAAAGSFESLKSSNETALNRQSPRRVINVTVKRGDIYYADLSPVVGSEQGGVRPVLIVQNDVGNRYSPTVIAAAITSQKDKSKLPTHIEMRPFSRFSRAA